MKKKVFATLLAVSMIASMVPAAVSVQAADGDSIRLVNGKIEVDAQLKKLAEMYEKETGTKVEIESMGGGIDIQGTLKGYYQSDNMPDIFVNGGAANFANWTDLLVDMSDQEWASDTDAAYVDESQGTIGFPYTTEAIGLAYNKDILDKAGIDPSTLTGPDAIKEAFETIDSKKDELGLTAVVGYAAEPVNLYWSTGNHLFGNYLDSGLDRDDTTYIDMLNDGGKVDEDLIEKINKETKITVQICPKTKEGYETSAKSNDIEKNVYGRLIDNSWIDNCWRNDAQTDVRQIMKIGGIDNNKDAVNSRLDELYNQGVRFVEYSESYGIDFQNIAEYIKSKEDLQLLVEVSEDMDKQTLYDMLNEAGLIQKTIAVVDTPAAFEEWNNINKAEDYLKIMFRADNDGMTMQQSLDYWKEYNIKAVCFGTNSYWSNVYLRNEDRVKEQNIAFFCENPTNDEERDFMLNPTDYTDNSEELQGITGFMTTFVTPEELAQKEATLETAKYFRDAADGSSIRDYLNVLSNSGYTVMFSVKDDGKEIDNIAGELNKLGIHSDILGAPEAFRNGYIAVVKTHTDGTSELVLEQSKSSEDGVALEADYTALNGRTFHLKSNGRKDDADDASPVAEISSGTVNYASNEAGLNIVVYDEENDCIVDRIWYDAWNNQGNDNPPLSKNHGKEWISLKYTDKKEERKQHIIEYFNNLAVNKDNYMVIMAVGDEGTSNMDTDIQNAMSQIGVTAAFDGDDSFQKSYVGLFANDLGELSFTNGSNDEFSDMKISLNDFSYDGHSFNVISEGNGLEDSLAQIVMDGQEMTNEQRGLHILVYDKTTHQPVNYTWIDCYDSLKYNSIDLVPQNN